MGAAAPLGRLRLAFWGLTCVLGALQAWAFRDWLNADGVSYLDLADAWARGDWAHAVSLYWSPAYPWLLALVLGWLTPSPAWEFPLVHGVNLLLLVAALASFEFLLRSAAPGPGAGAPGRRPLPAWAWLAWGYTLFVVAALELVTLGLVSPDLAVLGALSLVAGLLCRLRRGDLRWRWFLALGAALGAGYLVKIVLLPVAVLALALAPVAAGGLRRSLPRVLVALVVFAAVAGGWIAAMSLASGRFTLGEAARLNYLFHINDQYRPPAVRVPIAGAASTPLAHPPRKVGDAPAVYVFDEPTAGTFPLWYDPAYWLEGARGRFDPAGHARALLASVPAYGRIVTRLAPAAVGLVILLALTGPAWRRAVWPGREGVLSALSLLPLAGYALVHVEARYVAGFVLLLALGLLAAVRLPEASPGPRVLGAVCAGALGLQLLLVVGGVAYDVAHEVRMLARGDRFGARHRLAAEGLRELGLGAGARVAASGDYFEAGWARLARLRVAAVLPEPAPLECWPECRDRLVDALARARVVALVAEHLPARVAATPGWRRLGGTHYFAYRLESAAPSR